MDLIARVFTLLIEVRCHAITISQKIVGPFECGDLMGVRVRIAVGPAVLIHDDGNSCFAGHSGYLDARKRGNVRRQNGAYLPL